MSCEWFIQPEPPECAACGRAFEQVRIGVSAIGWAFSFDQRPDLGATDKASWLAYLADKIIVDEYGTTHTPAEFAAFVERKEGLRRAVPAAKAEPSVLGDCGLGSRLQSFTVEARRQ